MPKYEPIVSDVRQSKYGYWIVTISLAPAVTTSIMVAKLGISPDQARSFALGMLATAHSDKGTS